MCWVFLFSDSDRKQLRESTKSKAVPKPTKDVVRRSALPF